MQMIIVNGQAFTLYEWAKEEQRLQLKREESRRYRQRNPEYWREWRKRNIANRRSYNRNWMRRHRDNVPSTEPAQ